MRNVYLHADIPRYFQGSQGFGNGPCDERYTRRSNANGRSPRPKLLRARWPSGTNYHQQRATDASLFAQKYRSTHTHTVLYSLSRLTLPSFLPSSSVAISSRRRVKFPCNSRNRTRYERAPWGPFGACVRGGQHVCLESWGANQAWKKLPPCLFLCPLITAACLKVAKEIRREVTPRLLFRVLRLSLSFSPVVRSFNWRGQVKFW